MFVIPRKEKVLKNMKLICQFCKACNLLKLKFTKILKKLILKTSCIRENKVKTGLIKMFCKKDAWKGKNLRYFCK